MPSGFDNDPSSQKHQDVSRLKMNPQVNPSFSTTGKGAAEVFQTADHATALLILHDNAAKSLCYAAGKNRLIVPAENISAFRRALRKLGYVAPSKRSIG